MYVMMIGFGLCVMSHAMQSSQGTPRAMVQSNQSTPRLIIPQLEPHRTVLLAAVFAKNPTRDSHILWVRQQKVQEAHISTFVYSDENVGVYVKFNCVNSCSASFTKDEWQALRNCSNKRKITLK